MTKLTVVIIAPRSMAGMRWHVKRPNSLWKLTSLIDPVVCTRLEVNEFRWFKPQVDLLLSTFYRVTAMNDVSVEEDKYCFVGEKKFSNLVVNGKTWMKHLELQGYYVSYST